LSATVHLDNKSICFYALGLNKHDENATKGVLLNAKKRSRKPGSLFAKMIREARIQKELTQRELALLSKRSHGNVAGIERGYSIPNDDSAIINLARALDIDEEELLQQAEYERLKLKGYSTVYPAIFSLVSRIFSIVNGRDKGNSLNRFEFRLKLFEEDEAELAKNVIEFFKLKLKLDETPANGLRPLNHYFIGWCKEIEDW